MFRFTLAVLALCLSTDMAAAVILGTHQQVIDFTQPDQAAQVCHGLTPSTRLHQRGLRLGWRQTYIPRWWA